MPRHSRKVYFEDDIAQETTFSRRTRGRSYSRSRCAERVHSIFDDLTSAASATSFSMPSRDAYEQLLRENHYLRIQLRELEDTRAWAAQLERDNAALQREIRELRRGQIPPLSPTTVLLTEEELSGTSRREAKLVKKNNKLVKEVEDLRDEVDRLKAEADDWRRRYEKLADRHEEVKERLEKTENDKAAAARLANVYRQNLGVFEEAKKRLEEENAELKRKVNYEDMLRRRPY
jgi:uncharacterized coiled-coil DUF342 family protein